MTENIVPTELVQFEITKAMLAEMDIQIKKKCFENREEFINNAIRNGRPVVCICPKHSGLTIVLHQLGSHIPENAKYILTDVRQLNQKSRNDFCAQFRDILSQTEPDLLRYIPATDRSAFKCLRTLSTRLPMLIIIGIDSFHELPFPKQREFLNIIRRIHTEAYNEPLYRNGCL